VAADTSTSKPPQANVAAQKREQSQLEEREQHLLHLLRWHLAREGLALLDALVGGV
jgi:hypothetical protein